MTDRPGEAEPWIEYVQRHAHGAKQEDIAAKIGLHSASVGRWKDPDVQPRAGHVVAFARAYDRAPVEALIHAGYIKPEEVGMAIEVATSMRDVSDKAILGELGDRLADFRRLLVVRDDAQDWPPVGWRHENPGMSGVENGDNGG